MKYDIEKDKRNEDKANQLLDNVERIIGIRPVPISQDGFHSGVRIQIGDYIWEKDWKEDMEGVLEDLQNKIKEWEQLS